MSGTGGPRIPPNLTKIDTTYIASWLTNTACSVCGDFVPVALNACPDGVCKAPLCGICFAEMRHSSGKQWWDAAVKGKLNELPSTNCIRCPICRKDNPGCTAAIPKECSQGIKCKHNGCSFRVQYPISSINQAKYLKPVEDKLREHQSMCPHGPNRKLLVYWAKCAETDIYNLERDVEEHRMTAIFAEESLDQCKKKHERDLKAAERKLAEANKDRDAARNDQQRAEQENDQLSETNKELKAEIKRLCKRKKPLEAIGDEPNKSARVDEANRDVQFLD